ERGDRGANGADRDVEVLADVDQHRPGAEVDDDVRGRAEREGRDDDFVAWPDTERRQRDVEAGRARADGQGVAGAHVGGEVALEAFDLGTGRDPAGAQRVDDFRDLLLANRWQGVG